MNAIPTIMPTTSPTTIPTTIATPGATRTSATRRASLGVALAVALAGAACPQNGCNTVTQSQRSNLDRVSDAVLVNGPSGHSYVVSANPELQHLRVLDLTTAFFVQSPNRFFPTSIPVGPETRRITAAPDNDKRLYALDTSDDEIFEIVWSEQKLPSTTVPPLFTWTTTSSKIALPPGDVAPEDIAALDDDDGSTQLFVTVPEEHLMRMLVANDGTAHHPPVSVTFAPDPATGTPAEPGDVVVDAGGDTVVVADNALPVVHTIDRASIAAGAPAVVDLDVGGPVSRLAVGVVDIGDGLAPVVIALRSDANIAVAIRLFRPGFREPRVAVLGSTELPSYPLSAYVPDNRASSTVCCRGLSSDAVDAGEASAAWAAVGMANGQVTYVKLDAALGRTRPVVRLFDADADTIALDDAGSDWSPQAGDEAKQPVPTLTAVDNFGDPPLVPLLDETEQVSLVFEGPPPGLESVAGSFTSTTTFSPIADLTKRGLRAGDVVVVPPTGATDCDAVVLGRVASVTATEVQITADEPNDFAACTATTATVNVAFGAGDEFVAFRGNGDFLGRLSFDGGPDPSVELPGATLTIAASSSGPPTVRGSELFVPVDSHVSPVLLPLSDPPTSIVLGGGGFGSGGNLPTVIVGGEMTVPKPSGTQGELIKTRRMQIGTASTDDLTGLNAMFSCDEAESVALFCDKFE